MTDFLMLRGVLVFVFVLFLSSFLKSYFYCYPKTEGCEVVKRLCTIKLFR